MTQFGSGLAVIALALTVYFAVAAWQATADERRDAAQVVMWEPPEALTRQ